ncbi:hypothetical protein ACFFTM_06995 [Pseudoduganella plicata]|uniref:Uncharacterized protein n=1 Tax=Pseudoduganella plicata TaxID=321984 RepID=A0AA87Y1X0_9BURK|nr:hypothetical protein [Pseudoduganella plicata]GGY82041.1 hypothetical protein GCM10007388_13610 [Pseudoduganella plicata]
MTQDVTESLDDLPEELHAPVRAYMANFINMVKSGVAVVNGESNHSGPDKHPDSDEVDRDWRQSFMDDGYLVTAWRANQKQPRWAIFKEWRLVPKPTVFVFIDLHSESSDRKLQIYAALAPAADGRLKQCYDVMK